MALLYRYPAPEVVEEADAVRFGRVIVDLVRGEVSFEYEILTPAGDVSQAGTRVVGIGAWNNFISNTGSLPGTTFEEKVLSANAVTSLLPQVPPGGTVEEEGA